MVEPDSSNGWLFEVVLFLLGIVQIGFIGFLNSLQKSNSDAHKRITEQAESNNEKYARRDDVLHMEQRIISAIEGLSDKIDSRNINRNENH